VRNKIDSNRIINGNRVRVKDGEFIDKTLRRFKKKVRESGVLQDLREKEYYEKPTTIRKRRKAAAVNRQRKYQASQALPTHPSTKKHKK
jgi:small subunit ribosomal protein S21